MRFPLKHITLAMAAAISLSAQADVSNLTRVATVQSGAEITGLFIGPSGELFLNAQHPADTNPEPYNKANIAVINKANFATTGMEVPTGLKAGMIVSSLGNVEILASRGDFDGELGTIKTVNGEPLIESNDPDFNAFVPTGKDKGYLFTNWEASPGGMSRMSLERNGGSWKATAAEMIDFSAVEGTWINCFGTLSPWNTPLSAEELYFDNTADWNNENAEGFHNMMELEQYLGKFSNPYRYGYIVEIADPTGTATPIKRTTMGRFSHENAVVMPDGKTAYLSDDGTNVVFFKFIADTAGDLSAGTLYAAKVKQDAETDSAKAGFNVEWIELAHATEEDVNTWVADYDGITPADYKEGETSYLSDTEIADWAAGKAKDNRVAFLESRKAAAAMGASAEWRKMEGVQTNPRVPGKVFMAMSSIGKGMADDKGDIQVSENKCGVVYEMESDANHNIYRMTPMVAGMDYDKENMNNRCSVDSVSNPDNLLVLDNGDVLIGEDTSNHANNMLWVYRR